MGFGGISIWQLLIVLAIIVLLFGTKKLRGMGSDLGGALKGFKKAMSDDENADKHTAEKGKTEHIQNTETATPTDTNNAEKTKDTNKV